MSIAFIVLASLLIYTFLLYPLVLIFIGKQHALPTPPQHTPSVTVLVAAHNERAHITEKITNTLSADYPADQLSLLVGSDGSTDGTNVAVEAFEDSRVRLLALNSNQGKATAINAIAQAAESDILVISDADVTIAPTAIRDLVSHFSDDKVGAVCGRRSARGGEDNAAKGPARLYNQIEGSVKRGEGALGRVLGGDGSLYAIRRSCFRPLPSAVPDDFVNILRVLEQGKTVLYENRAVSWEDFSNGDTDEFARRRRTVARGIRGLASVHVLLNPFRFPLIAFMLLSHKVLRWCAGLILPAVLILNLFLLDYALLRAILVAQLFFYIAWCLGALGIPGPLGRPFRMVRYFVIANAAAVAGLFDALSGKQWTSWTVQRD